VDVVEHDGQRSRLRSVLEKRRDRIEELKARAFVLWRLRGSDVGSFSRISGTT